MRYGITFYLNYKMKYTCLHTHSLFCDGKDEIETFCETAYSKGFVSVGFSAHAPINTLSSNWHLKKERMEDYFAEVKNARNKWKDKLRVFLSLEVDYIRNISSPLDFQDYDLDYIIGAVHYVTPPNGKEPFTVDGPLEEFEKGLQECFAGDINALIESYWTEVESMIKDGGFDILAHIDLIKKNNFDEKYFSLENPPYLSHTKAIASFLSGSSIVAEINTGGLNRNKTKDTYPSLSVLRQLKEKNVPVIITADAHKAEHLGGNYETAKETLLKARYTKTVFFEGKQNNNSVWTEDDLT